MNVLSETVKFLKFSGFTSYESILEAGKVFPDIELLLLTLEVVTLLA